MTTDPVYHCPSCSTRPRSNLTLHEGKLWRPECQWTVAYFAMQHQTLAPHVLKQSRAAAHGLVVVDGQRRRRTRVR